jgi:hypothetical protein
LLFVAAVAVVGGIWGSGVDGARRADAGTLQHRLESDTTRRLLVGFSGAETNRQRQLLRRVGAAQVERLGSGLFRVSAGRAAAHRLGRLRVAFVVPDRRIRLGGALASAPGDSTERPTGAAAGHAAFGGALAQGRRAASGQNRVVVAVIDTGVDLAHPDLRDHRWVNAGEIPGNGLDDDHDGIVDDVNGANFIDHSGNPQDDEGHGSHVAGIVAASPNPAAGSGGVDPAAEIMALKVSKGLWMDLGAAAEAIYYATDHGARIINLSWGSRTSDPALEQAISYAVRKGVLVVAAAGNLRGNNDVLPDYPSSYPDPGILAVAATCDGQTIAPFSNDGKLNTDIAAPGCDVVSTVPGGYESLSGTSMAAPAVSGAAALLAATRPSAGGEELRRALLAGARPTSGLDGAVASGGALDVAGALAALSERDVTSPSPFAQVAPAKTFSVERPATNYYQEVTFAWQPSSDSALAGYEVLLDGTPIAGVGAGQTSLVTRVAPGQHVWSVVAYDRSGNTTIAAA